MKPAAQSIHATTLALLDTTIGTLGRRPDDATIHLARKASKQVRAALRLMRHSLGRAAYRRENRRMRDAARPLTVVRDAFMLIRTFKGLAEQPADLKRVLKENYRKHRENPGWQRSAVKLVGARDFLRSLPVNDTEAERVAAIAATRKVYKRGRAACREARSLEDDALHKWRKQTKYLLNGLELVHAVFGVKAKALRRRAGELADVLGLDHDLAVLARFAQRWNRLPRKLEKEIDKRRQRLQRRALRLGNRLFSKPSLPRA